jgi:uncharacterized protein (DUF58 family)
VHFPLDPELLTSLSDLELVARVTVDGTISGLHNSPFHGYSAEFHQYRHYRPGDDLKYVDWKLFARTDRVYTKQYRETTNLAAQLAIDASASMAYGGRSGVTKLAYARLIGAALAHVIAGQGDAVGLVVYDESLRRYMPPRTGQSHLREILIELARMQAAGGTVAATALQRVTDLVNRRGLLIMVSDLYDEDQAVESALRRASRIGHDIAVFHVLTREEIDYPFSRDAQLEDLETGRTLLTGAAAAAEYRREFGAFLERWRTRCATYGIDYTRVTTDMPLDRALRSYLIRRAGPAGSRQR